MIHDDGKIDYSGYSLRGLREARLAINAEEYPKNFANLVREFKRRGLTAPELKAAQDAESDYSDHAYSDQAKSPIAARLTGLATIILGVAWFLFHYRDGVYHALRGGEYTLEDEPILVGFFFVLHGSVVLTGLLGLLFGSGFYRDLIVKQRFSSSSEKTD